MTINAASTFKRPQQELSHCNAIPLSSFTERGSNSVNNFKV